MDDGQNPGDTTRSWRGSLGQLDPSRQIVKKEAHGVKLFGTADDPLPMPEELTQEGLKKKWTGIGCGWAKSEESAKHATRHARSRGGSGTPLDHPRRCQAKRHNVDEPCRSWAVKGKRFCRKHGGSLPLISELGRFYKLPSVYRDSMSTALRDRLDAMMEVGQDSLEEEIALARMAALQAIRSAEPVLIEDDERKVNPRARAAAIALLQDATTHVAKMLEAHARIKAASTGLPSTQFNIFVLRLVSAVKRACGDDLDLAARIVAEIEDVRLLPPDEPDNLVDIRLIGERSQREVLDESRGEPADG